MCRWQILCMQYRTACFLPKKLNSFQNPIEKRIKEAEKLGFKTCIIPESNKKLLKEKYKLDIIGVKNINEALKALGLK